MSIDPNKHSKKRIMGKTMKNSEVAKYIQNQLTNPNMTKSKLSLALGVSRPTIDKYLELAKEIAPEQTVQAQQPRTVSLEDTIPEFLENPVVKVWREFMKNKARGGVDFPEKKQNTYLNKMFKVCNTLQCPPQYFLMGDAPADILEQGRKLMRQYMTLYKEKKADVIYKKNWKLENVDPAHVAYSTVQIVRDFMKSHGAMYPNGEGGVMSQSVAKFHGKYADLKIAEDMHRAIQEELQDEHGNRSEEWLLYAYGVEAYGRQQGLLGATSTFTEFEVQNKMLMNTQIYESKTKAYKNGLWTKYIFDEDIQDAIKDRNKVSTRMFDFTKKGSDVTEMGNLLKKKYQEHDLDLYGQLRQGQKDTAYCIRKPFHILRHLGAQRILLKTNWHVAFVASTGWKTTQELIDSYGEMPPEQAIKVLGGIKL